MMKINKKLKIAAIMFITICSVFCFRKDISIASEVIEKNERTDFLRFVGDIYIANHTKDAYDKYGTDGIIDEKYKKLCFESDICIGNLECAISEGASTLKSKQFNLFVPKKYINSLSDIGFDALSLANNHVLDFGIDALLNTMSVLKEQGISYIGAGKNKKEAMECYLKEIDGKKYAILSASIVIPKEDWKAGDDYPGINNGFSTGDIGKKIKELKSQADKVIVCMHWGNELESHSNAHQRNVAHTLVDYGADLVVGTHPHIPQEIEYYNGVPIVYSLGNFIFGSTMREMIMLEVGIDYSENEKGDMKLRIYPGMSGYEKVYAYWKNEDIAEECKLISDRSTNCFIDAEGFVYQNE